MSHQPSAVLLFAAFYGLWRWSRGDWPEIKLVICGGLANAASVLSEYTTAIAVLALRAFGTYSYWKTTTEASPAACLRAGALFLAGALPLTVLLLWYHTRAFGGPLETGYRHLADLAYQPWHKGGFLGIGLPLKATERSSLSFFSPLRGLFALSPGLLLAGPGLFLLFRRARAEDELRSVAPAG